MKIRELKKELKKRNVSIINLLHFWDNMQSQESPVSPSMQQMPSCKAYIYRSEFEYISRCIMDYPCIETGGQLFGYWTADGSPVVVYAIGPGLNANHEKAFFNQDIEYLKLIGSALVNHYGLQHIGEWHSHHRLGLAYPSGHDASTMADTIREKNLGRFLLCIGNCNDDEAFLDPFNFTQECGKCYSKSHWVLYDEESLYRPQIDIALRAYLVHPRTALPACSLKDLKKVREIPQFGNEDYWFGVKENRLALKNFVDFWEKKRNVRCSIHLDESQRVSLQTKIGDYFVNVRFPVDFPNSAPCVYFNGRQVDLGCNWKFDGDIYSSLVTYLNALK